VIRAHRQLDRQRFGLILRVVEKRGAARRERLSGCRRFGSVEGAPAHVRPGRLTHEANAVFEPRRAVAHPKVKAGSLTSAPPLRAD